MDQVDSSGVEISGRQPLPSDEQWLNANGPLLATWEPGWVPWLCFQLLQERKMKKAWLVSQRSWFSPKSVLPSFACKLLACVCIECSWAVWPGVCELVHGEGFSFCFVALILMAFLPADRTLESHLYILHRLLKTEVPYGITTREERPMLCPRYAWTVWCDTVFFHKLHAQKL